MMKEKYDKPKIISHSPIRFETAQSGGNSATPAGGSFPGLGWGVDGTPAEERGDFPGGGNTGGVFPGKGPTTPNRP
jgi:hypothetical protein